MAFFLMTSIVKEYYLSVTSCAYNKDTFTFFVVKTFMGKVKEATFCHKTIYRRSVPEGDVGQNMKKVA